MVNPNFLHFQTHQDILNLAAARVAGQTVAAAATTAAVSESGGGGLGGGGTGGGGHTTIFSAAPQHALQAVVQQHQQQAAHQVKTLIFGSMTTSVYFLQKPNKSVYFFSFRE